ncbi:MAG: hypothetical protein WBE11_17220 [Candidatus Aminicenantaceae bacterium]
MHNRKTSRSKDLFQIKGVAVEVKKMYNLDDGLAQQMMQTMPKIR